MAPSSIAGKESPLFPRRLSDNTLVPSIKARSKRVTKRNIFWQPQANRVHESYTGSGPSLAIRCTRTVQSSKYGGPMRTRTVLSPTQRRTAN